MQLLSVGRAQSVWLFDANDLNPRGRYIFPDLIEWLKEEGQFEVFPKSPDDLDETKGLAFKRGSFPLGNEDLTVELTLYNDGVIANTYSSTKATDIFIENTLTNAAQEFDLKYGTDLIRSKTHLSEIVVRMEKELGVLNPKLSDFAKRISEAYGHSWANPFEVGGISFWSDTSLSALKAAPFALERKVNVAFSEHRYFSRAPLHTDDHFKLLEEFEQILAAP
jgi:hypothetical protein